MRRIALALALAAAAIGCATPFDDDEWATQSDDAVGWLDSEPVSYGDVARYIRLREPDVFSRNLTRYLLERVTRKEAGPLKITIPPALLARETQRRMLAWERRVRAASRAQTGAEVEPALWLQRVADISLAEFRDQVREGAELELLQDRLLRYEQLRSARVEVSVIVVEGKAAADRHVAALRKGADFAATAKEHSRHASAGKGGRIPFPLLALDIGDERIAKTLLAGKAGAIYGPFGTGSEKAFQIYRIEAVHGPERGTYAQLGPKVARGLEARPVLMGEYERWRRRALLRHGFSAAAAPGETG